MPIVSEGAAKPKQDLFEDECFLLLFFFTTEPQNCELSDFLCCTTDQVDSCGLGACESHRVTTVDLVSLGGNMHVTILNTWIPADAG